MNWESIMTNNIPQGWQDVTLDDAILHLRTGLNPRKNFVLNTEDADGYYVTVRELDGNGVSFSGTTDRVNQEALDIINRRSNLKAGDILFSGTGTIGRTAFVKEPPKNWNIKEGILAITPNNEIIVSKFMFYLLKSDDFMNRVNSRSDGAIVSNIKMSELKKFKIQIPQELVEQQRIADILSSLDDRIENCRAVNDTLEQMAQALFQSWFVDFEPVHKLAEFENGNSPHENKTDLAKSLYMTEKNLNLFPSKFDGNGLPMGWEKKTLSDIFDYTMGQSPKGETFNELGDGTLFFQGRAEFEWRFPKKRLYTTEPNRMAKSGDILFSVRAPVGDINLALDDCCIGRGLCAIRHKENLQSYGLYTVLYIAQRIKNTFDGEGTVFGSINKTNLGKQTLVSPTEELCSIFDEIASSIDSKIKNNEQEIQTLIETRNTLLPKLISGAIRVNNPDLPSDFIKGTLEGLEQAKQGKTTPYEFG